nr:Nef protein [Human immunodeficiency virus 1]
MGGKWAKSSVIRWQAVREK